MKLSHLVIVLVVALVAVGSVSKVFSHTQRLVVAEESSSTDDSGDDGEYTEFA